MKLKILGMALLAFAATSAFAATNAFSTPAGHFYHHGPEEKAAVTAEERATTIHGLTFTRHKPNSHATEPPGIHCEKSEYTGTVNTRTVQSIQMYPKYTNCTTEDGTKVTVHVNGCSYTFLSQGARPHATVIIDCEPNKAIEITHPNCTIKVPAQTTATTLTEGISYTQVGNELTADVTVRTITGHFEGGLCIFLGTNHKFEMTGSATVKGFVDVSGSASNHTLVHGAQIPITST